MISKKLLLLLALLLLFFTLGCEKEDNPVSPEDQVIGTWVLTKIIYTTPNGTIEFTPEAASISITLVINSDHTFSANVTQDDSTETIVGTWNVENGKVTIESTADVEPQVMDYSIEGDVLRMTINYTDDTGTQTVTLVFNKK
ncbi:MAG: lipocalin family protein [Ignavibacteriales bacterium]|nr:lipocalin family protein [Ignavibacteriales bacterium]